MTRKVLAIEVCRRPAVAISAHDSTGSDIWVLCPIPRDPNYVSKRVGGIN
jgi:hypothetical protein